MKFKRLLFFHLISMASNGHGQQYEAHRINYGGLRSVQLR